MKTRLLSTLLALSLLLNGAAPSIVSAQEFKSPPATPAAVATTPIATDATELAKRSPRLMEMDKILDQAPNFSGFMKRKDLQELYYQALAKYIGPQKLTPAVFNKILGQLSALNDKIPGFGTQLWEERKIRPPFALEYENELKATVTIDAAAWNQRLRSIQEETRIQAEPLLKIEDPEQLKREIGARVARIDDATKDFNKKLNAPETQAKIKKKYPDPAAAKEHIKVVRERYRAMIQSSRDVRELVAYGLHQKISVDGPVLDGLRSSNTDNVLETLTTIQDDFLSIFKTQAFSDIKSIPAALRDAARETVPNARKLANNKTLFKPIANTESHEKNIFYEVHRTIHAAFRGVLTGECVGGSCENLDKTTAARHAVPVLKGTETRFAEKSDGNAPLVGFTELVPVQNSKDGKVYGSLIIGHSDFKKTVYVTDPAHPGQKIKTTVFDKWLELEPKFENGIVMSGDKSGDNAGVLEHIKRTLTYQAGAVAGAADSFVHLPENQGMVQKISAFSPNGFGYNSRKQMIFDAMLPSANELTVPNPLRPEELEKQLRKGKAAEKLAFLLRTKSLDNGQKQKYFKSMRFLLEDPELEVRNKAARWVLDAGINDEKAWKVHESAVRSNALTSSELTEIVQNTKNFDVVPPSVMEAWGENFPLIESFSSREEIIARNHYTPEKLEEIAMRPSSLKAVLRLGETWPVTEVQCYEKRDIKSLPTLVFDEMKNRLLTGASAERISALKFYKDLRLPERVPIERLKNILENPTFENEAELELVLSIFRHKELPRELLAAYSKLANWKVTHIARKACLSLAENGYVPLQSETPKAWNEYREEDRFFYVQRTYSKNMANHLLDPAISPEVKTRALDLLTRTPEVAVSNELFKALQQLLHQPKGPMQSLAVLALAQHGFVDDSVIPFYIEALYQPGDGKPYMNILKKVKVIGDDHWLDPILKTESDFKNPQFTADLIKLAKHPSKGLEIAAIEASLADRRLPFESERLKEIFTGLLKSLKDPDVIVSGRALRAIGVGESRFASYSNSSFSARMAKDLLSVAERGHPQAVYAMIVARSFLDPSHPLTAQYERLSKSADPEIQRRALQYLSTARAGKSAVAPRQPAAIGLEVPTAPAIAPKTGGKACLSKAWEVLRFWKKSPIKSSL